MVRSTLIVRAFDALPLAASVDDEQVRKVVASFAYPKALMMYRQNKRCKNTNNRRSSCSEELHQTRSHAVRLRVVNTHYSASRTIAMASNASTYELAFSYLIADNVVYLVIADKSYPRKLAFSYLDELSKEFATSYGAKVEAVRKPYAFVGFGADVSQL